MRKLRQKFGMHPSQMALRALGLAICLSMIQHLTYGQLPAGFSQKKLTEDVINEATCMAHADDGRIFIAERSGKVKVFQNGTLSTIHSVVTNIDAEQGLLGIALHPEFSSNGKCYLFYTNQEKKRHYLDVIAISKANSVGAVDRVMQFDSIMNGNHNGGALQFKDGLLYIAIGESNRPEFAAQLDTYRGKILRLLDNGQPAPGNPYYSEAGASRQKRSIWAIGFRNPWRMSLDPVSGKLYVIDVGEKYEEINDITAPDPSKGFNYGWNGSRLTGPQQPQTTIHPTFSYAHPDWGCAITTGVFFNPQTTNYPSAYRNKFYFSDWCADWFRSMSASNPSQPAASFSEAGFGSILGTSVGIDGNIYYLKYNTRGSLWRIEYNNNQAPSIVNQPTGKAIVAGDPVSFSVVASGGAPIRYQWQKNGINIAGATASTYSIPVTVESDQGKYRCIVSNNAGSVASMEALLTIEPFNTRPVATILTPLSSLTWSVLDTVRFSGSARDVEDGDLPVSAYQWEVRFFHKENETSEHWHPGQKLPVGVKSGTFVADHQGESSTNIWFRLLLTVTDSKGRTGKDSVDIFPKKVILTADANISGMKAIMGGEGVVPFSRTFVVNSTLSLEAISPQTVGNNIYEFQSWQHGGEREQLLRVPQTNTIYKANFKIKGLAQAPFHGSPLVIPGKLEAEDFDTGGQGIAYQDLTAGNAGNEYRKSDDVDIEPCTEGGFNVGYVAAGEWLEYTVNVTKPGRYTLNARVAALAPGKRFHVELDGQDISGEIVVPVTGGFQAWQTVTVQTTELPAGQKTLRIVMDETDFNINYLTFTNAVNFSPTVSISSPSDKAVFTAESEVVITAQASDQDGNISKVEFFQGVNKLGEDQTAPFEYRWLGIVPGQYVLTAKATDNSGLTTVSQPVSISVIATEGGQNIPYLGTAVSLPGKIEAENFDKGGQRIAYYDLSNGNAGKDYRPLEDVDIEWCSEGGANIGYVAQGEWLEYAVNVTRPGRYMLSARVATPNSGRVFHVELNGRDISGPIQVPVTGGYQAWQTASVLTADLPAGQGTLRIVMDASDFNINYMTFEEQESAQPSVVITAPLNGSSFEESAAVVIRVTASAEDGTIHGVEFYHGDIKIGQDNNIPYELTWSSVPKGSYSITAKVISHEGFAEISQPVSFTVTRGNTPDKPLPRNQEDASAENKYIVFPNPADKVITIKGFDNNDFINIVSASTGRVTKLKPIGNTLDISKLLPGTYIFEFREGRSVIRKKFIKY